MRVALLWRYGAEGNFIIEEMNLDLPLIRFFFIFAEIIIQKRTLGRNYFQKSPNCNIPEENIAGIFLRAGEKFRLLIYDYAISNSSFCIHHAGISQIGILRNF